jgi:mono/diheme cytochrome c family protein
MTRKLTMTMLAALLGATAMSAANAYEGDWKRGRVYYRQVCTACHMSAANKQIGPNERTKAEWTAYNAADKHNKGKDTVKQYYSKQYRASIKATNKAAEKFADTPDQELIDDVKAFLIRSAKDGDAPAGCS